MAGGLTSGAVGTATPDDGDHRSNDEKAKQVNRRTVLGIFGVGIGITGLAGTADRVVAGKCSPDPKIDVTAVDKTNYPEIAVQVQIKTQAAENGLTKSAFTVREDGKKRSPLTCFQKLSEAGGGKVDIAFVIDDSYSMGDNLSAIENNIKNFADDVESAGLDARYGLVTFCSQKDPDEPNEIDQSFTSDVNVFKSTVSGVSANCGTREDNLDAINRAATDMSWRAGAQQVIIHACDESQKGSNNVITNPSTLTTKLQNKDITLYSVANPDDGGIQSNSIPPKTGGKLLDIRSNPDFSTFLDDIQKAITRGQYKLCYETPLLCTGNTRSVSVCVDDPDAGSIEATGTYDAPTSGEGCNRPPEAVCDFSFPGEVPATGEPITFDGSGSSDPNGDALTYEWDFDGDGSTDATGAIVDYTFTTGGEKTVTLTVTDEHGASDTCKLTVTVWIGVEINIKPGSDPNAINCKKKGGTPVAVLTTDDFDATRVDPSSLRFGAPSVVIGGGGAGLIHKGGHFEDAMPDHGSKDGDTDFVGHFRTPDTGFDGSQDTGRLEGTTKDGIPLVGTDSVKLVGCDDGGKDNGGKKGKGGK
ncbi:MAG: PKD domain-containing protein [Halobacteriales archaeon]|nr:PKD domain-containing protein [Halobacteriales archaeon]